MAGAITLVLAIQNVTQYSSLVQTVQQNLPSASQTTYVPVTHLYGVTVDSKSGRAVMSFTPFTSEKTVSAFCAQYGMRLIASMPAFGQYVFTLPQIQIGPGPQQHTATIYFPPYATTTDVTGYLANNALTVISWTSTSDAAGRSAVVLLPQVKPVLVDARRGIWRAMLAPNISPSQIAAWAKTNRMKVISYNPTTGELLIQGPKPTPVYVRVTHRLPTRVTTRTITNPATTKVYIAFTPGTTFNQAQQVVQQAGGQITTYNSGTELGIANVPVGQVGRASTSLSASPQVSCVSESSTACPGIDGSTSGSTSTTPTQTTTPTTPATTTASGNGWTTTDVTPTSSTSGVPASLSAQAIDGHVVITWTATSGAQSYQVYRAQTPVTATSTQTLIATTTATSLTDVGGTAGTDYSYRVVPVMTSGADETKCFDPGRQGGPHESRRFRGWPIHSVRSRVSWRLA